MPKFPVVILVAFTLCALCAGWAAARSTVFAPRAERSAIATSKTKRHQLRIGAQRLASTKWCRRTCDTTSPDTAITEQPPASTSESAANFSFTSTESGSKFECKLDSARWRSCGSPKTYTSLKLGGHSFSVRAIDGAGNVDATPASDTWSVETASTTPPPDTTPPDTTISSGPSGTISSTSASFSFSSTESGSSFECKLDSGAFAACTSPKDYSSLSAGAHTFSVRATDAAGNVDSTPATRSWTIEAAAPVEAVWSPPFDPRVNLPVELDGTRSTGSGSLSCTWTFEDETGATVWQTREGCAIDFTFESTGTKYVRLTVSDTSGGSAYNRQSFVVGAAPDTTPPDTTISSGPSGTISSTSASFSFSSTESGSSFECKLDSGAFAACTSPKDYSSLSAGAHTFSVRATDAAGNVDSTPATQSWTVEGSSPPPSGSHCFSVPSSCGYPDSTNTGVPPGTALTASGPLTVTTPGAVIEGKDVTGGIDIQANNVTIRNSRVSNGGNCGTTNTCGNWAIRAIGRTGLKIENVETYKNGTSTCEHDIRNQGPGAGTLEIVHSYLHACDSSIYSVGNTTLRDSYSLSKKDISTDHVENVYFADSTFTAIHSTMFNPVGQTAVIFGDVNGGSGGSCSNKLTVEDSLLAGGGYSLYPCGNGTSAGTSVRIVRNNHFARCLGQEVSGGGSWYCKGVTSNSRDESPGDGNGYYPKSGSYGYKAYDIVGVGSIWSGNVWDDNLAAISG